MVPVRKSNRRRGETAISGERIAEGEGRRNGRIRSSDVACLSFMGIRTMRSKTQSRHGWAFRLEHHRLTSLRAFLSWGLGLCAASLNQGMGGRFVSSITE